MRSDARKRSDNLSLRRGAGVVPSPGGDATTPAVVALTDAEREMLHERLATWFGDRQQGFLVSDLAPTIGRIIAARLAAAGVVSDAAAEVWDEGARAATADYGIGEATNPYRAAVSGVAAGSKADTQREDLGLDDFDVRYQR